MEKEHVGRVAGLKSDLETRLGVEKTRLEKEHSDALVALKVSCMDVFSHEVILTYIHTHIHTYSHTYLHTYVHTYIHTYMHACKHTNALTHTRSLSFILLQY